ncbi:MAG TPA: tetratricopeptide repeat protein [Opitutaceae bacterium]|nr:tetratricopeptide repeat protein [Opitutaceae bacterium]
MAQSHLAGAPARMQRETAQRIFSLWTQFALLIGLAFVAYAPALRNGVIWNDSDYITKPALRTFDGLRRIWTELGATEQYYPVVHSSFWLEHRLWGDTAIGYHCINVLWHAVSACLLLVLCRRLAIPGAFLAGCLFAVHPVAVESVAWISEQKNTLSTVFYLASAVMYLNFDAKRWRRAYAAASALFVLALLTKTVTATLPAALLVVIWWKRGSLHWRKDVVPLIPWLLIGAAMGLFSGWVERQHLGAHGPEFRLTFVERTLVAGRALWFYLLKAVWPEKLIFFYPHWVLGTAWWQFLFPLLAAGMLFALWRLRTWSRTPLAIALLFAGTLFPTLGFLNVYAFIFSFVADHWEYLALLGPIVVLAAGWARWQAGVSRAAAAGSFRWTQWAPVLAAVGVVSVFAVLSWRRCHAYRDAETLYRTTLAQNPDAWLAHNNLGVILADRGDYESARREYLIAERIHPLSPEIHNNLGDILAKSSATIPAAIDEYEKALRIKPGFPEAQSNLAAALLHISGREDEAVAHAIKAVRLKPDFAAAHYNLANALRTRAGHLASAVAEYHAALRLDPEMVEAWNNLGTILLEQPGGASEAAAAFRTAIRLRPSAPALHFNLAVAEAGLGHNEDAIAEFQTTLRCDPTYPDAAHRLGLVLLSDPSRTRDAVSYLEQAAALAIRDGRVHADLGVALLRLPGSAARAQAEFEAAIRCDPTLPDAHYNLGNLLAAQPAHHTDAIREYESAIKLAPQLVEAHFNLAVLLIRDRIRLRDAVQHLETVLKYQPGLEPALVLLSRLGVSGEEQTSGSR